MDCALGTIVQWRGANNVLPDLAMRPDFMHRMISRLMQAHSGLLDQLDEQGLLGWGQSGIHCTGAYTDELPAPGFDPQRVRPRDLWTYGRAQIFAAVSPSMHKEFWLDYAIPYYERFGLVYYGCCEPLHHKIDIIRRIPHVRKISISPWADVESAAEQIGRDFVLSRKPSPAFFVTGRWDPQAVEADLRDTLERGTRHGCPVELILKDISTVCYRPQHLWEWADIAMRMVGAR